MTLLLKLTVVPQNLQQIENNKMKLETERALQLTENVQYHGREIVSLLPQVSYKAGFTKPSKLRYILYDIRAQGTDS